MEAVLADEGERNHRIYNIPTSAITLDGKKIRYFDFISSLEYEECNRALKRILPRIDMDTIDNIIENITRINQLKSHPCTSEAIQTCVITEWAEKHAIPSF